MSGLEVLLALLAALGLLALGWLLFGRLLAPVGAGTDGGLYAVLRGTGDGARLEQDVNGLLWLAGSQLAQVQVVIVDAGLSPDGVKLARGIVGRRPEVRLCTAEELRELFR